MIRPLAWILKTPLNLPVNGRVVSYDGIKITNPYQLLKLLVFFVSFVSPAAVLVRPGNI
jgi:hypothetical protein